MRDLREMTLGELEQAVAEAGEAPYRARQVMRWLWTREAASVDAMHEVPARLRQYLKRHFKISRLSASCVERSADGTRKLLLRLDDGVEIESVIIPAEDRTTLCISSQAGCAMACQFCATARMGLHRNLAASEILGQIIAARPECSDNERLTNYVFMGMGEPLANYVRLSNALTIMTAEWGLAISPRRITVSTVGLVPAMERLLADFPVNLAVSLHATLDQLRDRLAPINRRYPLAELLDACRRLPLNRRSRITFEYVMLSGVNDSFEDARRLLRMLAPLKSKVNLILFNPFAGALFQPSPREQVENFQAILLRGNLTATIRESRGQDIAAACGQLYAQRGARIRTEGNPFPGPPARGEPLSPSPFRGRGTQYVPLLLKGKGLGERF
ncbi:MAG: 23S rRNA (adenine(2503)-C(2))-methyltransferase RlmN [Deltaproteobacteria bacterium]|nr:23S rRNA (adenine(2503)-C(2))-methyltransferase RlmN [Deltaproteobacteria bacterium]